MSNHPTKQQRPSHQTFAICSTLLVHSNCLSSPLRSAHQPKQHESPTAIRRQFQSNHLVHQERRLCWQVRPDLKHSPRPTHAMFRHEHCRQQKRQPPWRKSQLQHREPTQRRARPVAPTEHLVLDRRSTPLHRAQVQLLVSTILTRPQKHVQVLRAQLQHLLRARQLHQSRPTDRDRAQPNDDARPKLQFGHERDPTTARRAPNRR